MSNLTIKPIEKLRFVDYLSLEDMAQFFDEQAEVCRLQASEQKPVMDDMKQAAAMDFLMRSPRITMRYLNEGNSLKEAIEKTAKKIGAPVKSINRAWYRFTHDKSLYEMRRRNRLILELATMGFTNADIGRKVNLHPNSVSRIISKARKEYHSARTACPDRTKMLLTGGMITTKENPIF